MKSAIIVHGMPSKEEYFKVDRPSQSNSHWLPWLQHQLIINGFLAQTPEMPEPYKPNYEKWRSLFERFEIREDTFLVGHSCGGGFLVRYLSENNIQSGKLLSLLRGLIQTILDLKKDFLTLRSTQTL